MGKTFITYFIIATRPYPISYDLLTQNDRAILNSQDKGKSQGEIEENVTETLTSQKSSRKSIKIDREKGRCDNNSCT